MLVCRFCGHKDYLNYCSQCGLPLDHGVETGIGYVWARLTTLLEGITQFFFAFLPLLIRPRTFFRRLSSDDLIMDGLQMIWSRPCEPTFGAWRRPMSPGVYLATVTVLIAAIGKWRGVAGSIDKWIEDGLPPALSDLPFGFVEVVLAPLTLVIVVALFEVSRLTLRVKRSFFTDYFLYTTAQFALCYVLLLLLLGSLEWLAFLWIPYIGLSIYFFIIIPLSVLPGVLHVSRLRLIVSYFVTLVPVTILFGALIVWLAIALPEGIR